MKIFIFLVYTVIIYNYNHNYTVILGDINTKVDNEKVTGVTDGYGPGERNKPDEG